MRRLIDRGLGGWSRSGVVLYGCLEKNIGRQADRLHCSVSWRFYNLYRIMNAMDSYFRSD